MQEHVVITEPYFYKPQSKNKIVGEKELRSLCFGHQLYNGKIVLTTGAFDLLHRAHLLYLEKAATFADLLVVGVCSDEFVRKLKGPERPIFPQEERARIIAGLGVVDYVHIFNNRLDIIELVKPDFFVMSATSHAKPETRLDQQALVKKYGGEVIILDEMANVHTSQIIHKIQNLPTDMPH